MRLRSLKSLSAFARPDDSLVRQTTSGAIVSVLGLILAAVLFTSELAQYINPVAKHEVSVELERTKLLKLSMDITFPALPCSLLSIDLADSSGDVESDGTDGQRVEHLHLHKVRLDAGGRRIGGDYHAPRPNAFTLVGGLIIQDSQQHIDDMKQEFAGKEGCRVHGHLDVKRLAGNLQVTVHYKDWLLAASLLAAATPPAARRHNAPNPLLDLSRANVSHHITHFAFGPSFPGQVNPLDGFTRIVSHDYGSYSYFTKVVPTTYMSSWWLATLSCQYSVGEYFAPGSADAHTGDANGRIPAVSFSYDMSPLNVKIWYPSRSAGHFAVRLCAVVGGCFALTGWVDGLLHALLRLLGK